MPGFEDIKLSPEESGLGDIKLSPEEIEASGDQQYTPLETFGLHSTNVFGGGAAIGGLVNSILRGGSYEQWRDAFRRAEQESEEQNPKAALGGKIASVGAE